MVTTFVLAAFPKPVNSIDDRNEAAFESRSIYLDICSWHLANVKKLFFLSKYITCAEYCTFIYSNRHFMYICRKLFKDAVYFQILHIKQLLSRG